MFARTGEESAENKELDGEGGFSTSSGIFEV